MPQAHIWQSKPEPITEFSAEEVADVVVVGAGIAGCTAAQSVAESGASVICIETFDQPSAHGVDIGAIDSILQREAGIEISPIEAARLIYAWSQQQANYQLIRTFTERSGEVMSHYVQIAREAGYTVHLNTEHTARADWDTLDDRFRMFRTAHVFNDPNAPESDGPLRNVVYAVRVIYESALSHGAKFYFNTPAEQLIKENGRVVGVAVADGNGGYKRIIGRNGVIMATGGITNNKEMIECFCPMALYADGNAYTPVGGNDGDGHILCAWAGAAFSRCFPAPLIHPVSFTALKPGMDSSWLAVNRNGKRFCNETAWEPIVTNARISAPGNIAWSIWDSDYLEHYKRMEPIKYAALPDDILEEVEECVAKGKYVRADSIEELAEAIGVPADNLVATVARYNELVDSGVDEDFGVPERFLSPCKRGPFYASKISAVMLSLLYGMRVDDNSQVCDACDDPIPGLYAVGAVQGDFFANSYPVTMPGADHGRALCFGRLVGLALAKGENIDGTPAA